MDVRLRPMHPADWPAVARIYAQGIASGDATFERRVPEWSEWDAARHAAARLVAEDGSAGVVGFACVSPVSSRPVYRGVCEVMVYVAEEARGAGLGRRLMEALVATTEEAGIWTLQAGIFPENRASVAVHEAVGFRHVGVRERLGRFHDGRWRDVLLLERRSEVAGVD